MTPSLQTNIVANFVTRAWGFASAYLFVPLYLRFLGIESYGLIGFYSTLLVVLGFADMGLTATLSRELARLSARDNAVQEMRDLLRTYESVYLAISMAVAVAIWVGAPLISTHWLDFTVLQPAEATSAIRVLGLSIALQLPFALYLGGLMGLQEQVRASYLQVAVGVFRGFGGVLVLWLVSPTILAFALWQLVSTAINCYASRLFLWQVLSTPALQRAPRFRWQALRNTWRYAAGMASMAVLSALQTQTDRLVVSKTLPLETFAYYSLAGALASIPLLLSSAIASAVFPRLTALVAAGDRDAVVGTYHRGCALVAVATFPAAVTLAAFSHTALLAWTGSTAVAENGASVASFLLVGQLMQAAMTVPFYLGLAHGNVRLTVHVGVWSVLLLAPLLIYLIPIYGVLGAGMAWVLVNVCTMPPYMYLLHRRFLPGQLGRWCTRGVAAPLLAALAVVAVGRALAPSTQSRWVSVSQMALVFGAALAACVAVTPVVSDELTRRLRGHPRTEPSGTVTP